jgi:hypothetical protein
MSVSERTIIFLDAAVRCSGPASSTFGISGGETESRDESLQHSLARRARLTRVAISAHTLRHNLALYTRPSRDDLAADLERSHLNVDG